MTPEQFAKATPRPWVVAIEHSPAVSIGYRTQIWGAGDLGRPVASTIYPLATASWRAEDEANAAFIIEAGNAYERDHETVRVLVEALEAIAKFQLHPSDTPALGFIGCQDLARQALALAARGEEK